MRRTPQNLITFPDRDTGSAHFEVATIADLQAIPVGQLKDGQAVQVLGYHTAGDSGGGTFRWSATSAATANAGTIFAPDAGAGRWLRVFDGALNVCWFGAKGDGSADDTDGISKCIAALPNGGEIFIPRASVRWRPVASASTENPLRTGNLSFIGEKCPKYNNDFSALEKGSVIAGPFVYGADNISFENIGIDSGSAVCASYGYAGTAQEGLICTVTYLAEQPQFTGLNVRNVRCLAKNAVAAVHAFAAEGYSQATIHGVETYFGTHGQAYKLQDSNVSRIISRNSSSNCVIIKSDETRQTARCNFNNIVCDGVGAAQYGISLECNRDLVGNYKEISEVNVSNAVVRRAQVGYSVRGGLSVAHDIIYDCSFTNCSARLCTVAGFYNQHYTKRVQFVNCRALQCDPAGFQTHGISENTKFMRCSATNGTGVGFHAYGQNDDFDSCTSTDNGTYGFFCNEGSTAYLSSCNGSGNGTSTFGRGANVWFKSRNIEDFIAPTFEADWSDYNNANQACGYTKDRNNIVHLKGLAKYAGAGAVPLTLFTLPVEYRPLKIVRFPSATYNGTTQVYGEIYVQVDGQVILASGGKGYVSLDGISFNAFL